MADEIRYKSVIVADSPVGGTLDLISPDGEIVNQFHVPQGRHRASQWLDLVEPGYRLQIGGGCVCFQPRMGAIISQHPLALKSDANPDFVPTSVSRMEREMRIRLNEMGAMQNTLAARIKALDSVQRAESIPTAPKPKAKPKGDPAPVVEDENEGEA